MLQEDLDALGLGEHLESLWSALTYDGPGGAIKVTRTASGGWEAKGGPLAGRQRQVTISEKHASFYTGKKAGNQISVSEKRPKAKGGSKKKDRERERDKGKEAGGKSDREPPKKKEDKEAKEEKEEKGSSPTLWESIFGGGGKKEKEPSIATLKSKAEIGATFNPSHDPNPNPVTLALVLALALALTLTPQPQLTSKAEAGDAHAALRALALRPADKEVQRWAFRALANALDSGGEAARVQLCGTGTSAAAFEAVRALRQHQGTRAIELQVPIGGLVLTSAREGWPLRLNKSVYL